jgi:hypothetical protein
VPKPHDFRLKLTRVIEPKGQPGVELATLDAARLGKMRPFKAGLAPFGLCGGADAHRRGHGEEADIERATAQMERALRRDNLL